MISGSVNTAVAGTYTITYSVSDAAGNNASVNRTVNVIQDTTPPVITLIGSSSVDVVVGTSYTEQGATATDNVDGDITANIVISGSVNNLVIGTYIITYSVTDSAGNNASINRTVNVVADTVPPIITLIGDSTINLNVGDPYTEQGATALDNVDGDLTSSISISGSVNTAVAGTYILTYSVTDSSGNNASVNRTVNVIADTTPPVITLNGSSVIDINVGDSYTELGATATDNVDGDLTSSIVISGSVNTAVAGTYIINYSVSDAAGNNASVNRTVNVNELPLDQILSEGYFESGNDGWTLGGKDAARTQSSLSFEGLFSIRLRDDSGVAASMTSPTFDATSFNSVEITFYLITTNYENGESVLLRYFNGSSWSTVRTYIAGTDFSIGSFYQATFTVNSGLASNAQFRIQSNASNKNDQVYIDQVIITGINSSAAARSVGSTDSIVFIKDGPGLSTDLRIYPNPVKDGYLNIESLRNEEVGFRIYDLTGKLIMIGKARDRIDVSTLQQGVYMLDLWNKDISSKQKFVKE